MTRHIVIIGAGFSGALTAVNLLRHSAGAPLRVSLVNLSGRMARGIAYGTASAEHVLNVPAGNMSALADDPDDFLRYCRWANPAVQPSSFVSRRLYGSYLEALLDAAEHGAHMGASLERVSGEAVRLDLAAGGSAATVHLADGRALPAHQVVLAFGHFAPRDPAVATPAFYDSARYVRDPWAPGVLDSVAPDEPVLLLGCGLTAVDVALKLAQLPRQAPIWCVSRRGLMPQPHREQRGHLAPHEASALVAHMGRSAASYLRAVRASVRQHEAQGGDWRNVIAALRPHTPELWRRLDTAQRERFLRQLQPFWDVARHRCAPDAHERFQQLLQAGAIRRVAGRVRAYEERGSGVDVALQPRGEATPHTLHVARVINCTGPSADLRLARHRLVRHLLAERLLRPDPNGVGLDVNDHYEVVGHDGQASQVLHYVGPLLRARDWEATAVPELRVHAHRLAVRLLQTAFQPAAHATSAASPAEVHIQTR
ncbi:FAD/NAD(P)-binding protein [Ideonella sp. BN130291]|uniref:FAD/NAD(P)-binding protein n=1 Tax=Ideonella sp. BN130291 TaxID=3112940 RepID=UPI002E255F28|nr:FAD/NAD(P)-binding protein [Ideonella sp. BN130291]